MPDFPGETQGQINRKGYPMRAKHYPFFQNQVKGTYLEGISANHDCDEYCPEGDASIKASKTMQRKEDADACPNCGDTENEWEALDPYPQQERSRAAHVRHYYWCIPIRCFVCDYTWLEIYDLPAVNVSSLREQAEVVAVVHVMPFKDRYPWEAEREARRQAAHDRALSDADKSIREED